MTRTTPFIIWTLQRTGGTNLARRLFERSGLLAAALARGEHPDLLAPLADQWKLHEPFNYGTHGRVFGYLVEQWLQNHDDKQLAAAMERICSLGLPIKHCVEMVPAEVSQALAEAACKSGYAHIFLYRKNPVDRLLSLHFANQSGIWGPELRGDTELGDEFFSQPLPITELVEHERHSIARLMQAWEALRRRGSMPFVLSYEEIFQPEFRDEAISDIVSLLGQLRMAHSKEADERFAMSIIAQGEQGTRDHYRRFYGVSELESALGNTPAFAPDIVRRRIKTRALFQPSDIMYAFIKVSPHANREGTDYELTGVVVLREPPQNGWALRLRQGEHVRDIKWGLHSPGMAKRFPESPNSAYARFRIKGVQVRENSPLEIDLERGAEGCVSLFQITA